MVVVVVVHVVVVVVAVVVEMIVSLLRHLTSWSVWAKSRGSAKRRRWTRPPRSMPLCFSGTGRLTSLTRNPWTSRLICGEGPALSTTLVHGSVATCCACIV